MWPFDKLKKSPASKRKLVADSLNDRHFGKAMCVNTPEGVSITTECDSCGQLVIGPIHPLHLRSLAAMIDGMADSLGLASRHDSGSQHITEQIYPHSADELATAQDKFKSMSMDQVKANLDLDEAMNRMSPADLSRLLGKPGKVH